MSKNHYVYIVECADGTYYTGYTTSLERRLNEHNYEEYKTVSEALRREHQIKKMSRKKKIELIEKKM